MGIRNTLKSAKKITEWALEQSYRNAYRHMDTNFEEWMEHRIADRVRARRQLKDCDEFVVFHAPAGKMTEDAYTRIKEQFDQNPEAVLVYADEDVPLKNRYEGEEYEPWLKPMWSPEFFLSCFYFGNFFAIRKSAYERFASKNAFCLEQVLQESNADTVERMVTLEDYVSVEPDKNGEVHLRPGENESFFMDAETIADVKNRSRMRYLYRMCFDILTDCGAFAKDGAKKIVHIPEILFRAYSTWDVYRIFDMGALKFQGISVDEIEHEIGVSKAEKEMVSIVIPSKDHPEILERCIASLREETETELGIEIIVIDNGSSGENRMKLEAMSKRLEVRYFYEPMEFNFSKMCNLGVQKSKGDYILLLNDDMEIIQSNWLDELVRRVRMPYAGAVGAKLLYPESSLIQHAGITNIRLGPTHKLQRMDDMDTYYFGQNRMAHDMIGVTGACLLVRKSLYEAMGGLKEELRVAFNDVDFCFTLFENGYSNIVCNDVILYHHESLSRGNDLEDEAKTKRLNAEKEKLFGLHPALFAKDPYYSQYMTFDVSDVGYSYYFMSIDFNRNIQFVKPRLSKLDLRKAREDQCLCCGVEYHDLLQGWVGAQNTDAPEDGYLQGYSFIIGSNNACYERRLLLRDERGKIYDIVLKPQYRPDVAQNVTDQKNVELSGFAVQIPKGNLPEGNYQIGLYARKRLAKEELVRWTTCYLPMGMSR